MPWTISSRQPITLLAIALAMLPLLVSAALANSSHVNRNRSDAQISSTEPPSQPEAHSVSNRSHVKPRILATEPGHDDGTTENPKSELGIISRWSHSKTKDFIYTEGFFMRSLVVIILCILVAMVLVFVRGLKDRQPKNYASLNNQMFSEKAGQAGVRLILDEDDESDEELFNSSQHKQLLSKDRK